MQLKIENIKENPVTLLRSAGYVFQRKEGQEMSFVRVLARAGYPRFHIYCHLEGAVLLLNLHLDQKRETYGDDTRHHGEYEDSAPVREEHCRLETFFKLIA